MHLFESLLIEIQVLIRLRSFFVPVLVFNYRGDPMSCHTKKTFETYLLSLLLRLSTISVSCKCVLKVSRIYACESESAKYLILVRSILRNLQFHPPTSLCNLISLLFRLFEN